MKIAILITCSDESDFSKRHPDDGQKFISLLSAVRSGWEFCPIPVRDSVFPDSPDEYDAYIVCGSVASVNGQDRWIGRLLDFIRQLDANRIPLFGCCFGHQAIAKALGGEVSGNPNGWSAGIETTRIVRTEDWMPRDAGQIDLYSFHLEQVSELPSGCRVVGTSRNCPIASLARGNHVFTTQYHPEMSASYATELVEDMAAELAGRLTDSRDRVRGRAQGTEFAEWIARFLEFASVSRITADRGTPDPVGERHNAALDMARRAGASALRYFRDVSNLKVESKGPGDLVSEADMAVEQLVRDEISSRFPDDGIVGEEFGHKPANTGFTWVIDPIDGTANFVRGIPSWCVIIACIRDSVTVSGIIFDPTNDELYHCRRNGGAWLNDRPVRTANLQSVSNGITGFGYSPSFCKDSTIALVSLLLDKRCSIARKGSGALDIAYVACGRYVSFIEERHKVWDCLAGLLLVEEAGGIVLEHDPDKLIEEGGRIVVSGPFVFEEIRSIADKAFG